MTELKPDRDPHRIAAIGEHHSAPETETAAPVPTPPVRSMHEDVAPWSGCGSCGAEPYWIEIAAEMGMSPDGDAEDAR
ncbi:hypothetical protein [Thiocystis violacea]|uniref:hypothetical protein n=1 Tax=Thiocystis violacea TaxID=13725 RepID=UPI001908D05F|nr:hypothetical protein [Thiocystis violacea]MBK1722183.1 hypothetical protein [Thiocystis violacea]